MPTPQLAIITAGVVIAVLVPQLYETWKQHKKFHPDDLKPGERHTDPRDKTGYAKDEAGNLTITQADGTVIEQNIDGTKITTYPDGRIVTIKPDGTKILQAADKSKEIQYQNGTIETIDKDGNALKTYPDGRREGVMIDSQGLKQKFHPDGSVEAIDKDGNSLKTYPDGHKVGVMIDSQGTVVRYLPDGTINREFVDKTFKIEFPDGSIKTIDAYGNGLVRRPDGSLEGKLRDPQGVVHLYQDGQEYIKDANNQWVSVDTGAPLISPTNNN